MSTDALELRKTMERPKRHHFGLTDRLGAPRCVRWYNVISVGPALAAMEAEMKNPGWTAHEAYVKDEAAGGLCVWRVELWPHD